MSSTKTLDSESIKNLVKAKLQDKGTPKGSIVELEIRFQSTIDYYQFRDILEKLTFAPDKGGLGLKNYSIVHRMDIKTNDNVRLSIFGADNVKLYWLKNGLDFLKPDAYKFIRKNKVQHIDLTDYDIRVSLANESDISKDEEDANVKTINDATAMKNYRMKNTYQIISRNGLFRYDLSSIKMVDAQSFKKSNIFQRPVQHEIELEYIGPSGGDGDLELVLEKLTEEINLLSGLIQGSDLLITKAIQQKVIENLGDKASISVHPVTLQPDNLLAQNSINILSDYAVTYKADGIHHMLYVYNGVKSDPLHGTMYLIDDTLKVRRTGYVREDWAGAIIEGEFIKNLNTFLAYDMLWNVGGKDLRSESLYTKTATGKTRLGHLKKFMEDIQTGMDYDDPRLDAADGTICVKIVEKPYKFSMKKGDIFELVKELEDVKKQLDYETDGYIFTPMKDAYPSKAGKWPKLLKWKNPKHNSIDFLVRVEKNEGGQDVTNPLMLGKGKIRQYKSLVLHVGGLTQIYNKDTKKWNQKLEPVEFNPYNAEYNEAKAVNRANIILNKQGKMSFFDHSGNRWEEILDDTIVEFVWDEGRDVGFQWMPIRVRHDKTTKYKNGENIYGNFQDVANSNWISIVYPITLQMLTTGEIPPAYLESIKLPAVVGKAPAGESYYKNCQVSNYNSSKRLPLQNFHNLIVKMNLIRQYSPLGRKLLKNATLSNTLETPPPTPVAADEVMGESMGEEAPGEEENVYKDMKGALLDLACGKGGDINKWKKVGLKKVVSVDIDAECIKYATEYYNSVDPPKPLVTFLQGNSGKLIFPEYKVMMQDDDLKQYQESFPAKYMFDMVSLQFCLHYFFEKEVLLRTLLQNANDNLKIGGYFIGTCFDGSKIFELLKGKKMIEGKLNEMTIWKIEKKYANFVYKTNSANYNKKISVFTSSIGHAHDEYLVNFEYLDTLMIEYGFEKAEVKNFGDIYTDFEVDTLNNKINKACKMSVVEKEVSFLNNIFAYKKIKHTPDKIYSKLKVLIEKKSGGGGVGGVGDDGDET